MNSSFNITSAGGKTDFATLQTKRKVEGPIAEAMRQQCMELAKRELIRTFGYDASSIEHSVSVIETVANKAVDQFTGGGWIDGISLPQVIRNELLIQFGGIEYIRKIIHAALLDQRLRATDLPNDAVVARVTNDVVVEFAEIHSNSETVYAISRKKLQLFLADIETYEKAEDSEDAKYKVREGSLDGAERKSEKRLRTARESASEQEKRAYALTDGMDIIRNSKNGKAHILDLTMSVMTSSFPPEMFNVEKLETPKLSVTQQNDLAVNFLLYTLQNNRLFTPDHRLVVYMMVWRGMTEVEICEEVRIYEEKDQKKYELTTDKIKKLYDEVVNVLKQDGEKLLNTFLAKMNPLRTDNQASMLNYDDVARNVRMFIDKTTSKRSATDVNRTYAMSIEFPQSEYDKTLEETDIILLQHGNITARSRALVRLLRMIGKMVHGSFGKYWVHRSGTTEDFSDIMQGTAEMALKKLIKVDPSRTRITTYMMTWIKSTIQKYVIENDLVESPVHVFEIATTLYHHPEMPDEAVANKHKASLATVQFVRNERARGMIYIDEPVRTDKGDGADKGNFIPELRTGHNVQLRQLEEDTQEKLIQAVLRILPAREAEILRMRFFENMTLEAVGKKFGLTHERIRQIEAATIKNILGEPTAIIDDEEGEKNEENHRTINTNIILVADREGYKKWLEDTFHNPTDRKIAELYMGLDADSNYGRCSNKQILDILAENGEIVDKSKVSKTIKKAKKEMERTATLITISREEAYGEVRRMFRELSN